MKKSRFLLATVGALLLASFASFAAPLRIDITQAPYLATPDDATDDTAAIQGALDALLAADGGCLIIPAGVFRLSEGIGGDIDVPIAIKGEGASESVLVSTAGNGIFAFNILHEAGFSMKDFSVEARSDASHEQAIRLIRQGEVTPDSSILGPLVQRVHVYSSEMYPFRGGLLLPRAINARIVDCLITGPVSGQGAESYYHRSGIEFRHESAGCSIINTTIRGWDTGIKYGVGNGDIHYESIVADSTLSLGANAIMIHTGYGGMIPAESFNFVLMNNQIDVRKSNGSSALGLLLRDLNSSVIAGNRVHAGIDSEANFYNVLLAGDANVLFNNIFDASRESGGVILMCDDALGSESHYNIIANNAFTSMNNGEAIWPQVNLPVELCDSGDKVGNNLIYHNTFHDVPALSLLPEDAYGNVFVELD